MSSPPMLTLRAKTQMVTEGISRFMGEQFQYPQPIALGYVGAGEVEQVVDLTRPLTWENNAPGPHEAWQQYGDPQTQGSREGAIGGGPAGVRGGAPGGQQTRQIAGQNTATFLRAQQYDDYRNAGTAGLQGPTDQFWQKGAVTATSGVTPGPISPQAPGAQTGEIPERELNHFPRRAGSSQRFPRGPQQGPQRAGFPPGRPPGMFPPGRPPGFTPPRPPGREQRSDEARHERREERYDARHAEARHERREDRYDKRHDDRRAARYESGRRRHSR